MHGGREDDDGFRDALIDQVLGAVVVDFEGVVFGCDCAIEMEKRFGCADEARGTDEGHDARSSVGWDAGGRASCPRTPADR